MTTGMKKKILLRGLFTAVTVASLSLCFGRFSYSSVCSHCGAEQSTLEGHIPFTPVRLFQYSSLRESPLSRVLLSSGLVQSHRHDWLFNQGGGNGVFCALGPGAHIWPTASSPAVARFVESASRYADRRWMDTIVHAALSPESGQMIRSLAVTVPAGGFSQASDFRAWQEEQSVILEQTFARTEDSR